jgi:N-acetylglucosaminyldiphosphoundecaprenol N-acetyl-beta-D-mannosaminyltransferase
MPRCRVLNGSFDCVRVGQAVDAIARLIRSGGRGYVATVNVAMLMMMRSDDRLQRFVDRATLIVADGQPIVWASRWISAGLPERVAGIDLLHEVLATAERERFGVFLLGARRSVLEAATARIRIRHPGLTVCGTADGYFSDAEAEARVRAIADSHAQILVVGMGVPRQEYFLDRHWADLGVNVAIGVGGSLDVIAGARYRAPEILRRIGLEWLFRLAQEPRRLWKRYLVTNSQFVYLLLKTRRRLHPGA